MYKSINSTSTANKYIIEIIILILEYQFIIETLKGRGEKTFEQHCHHTCEEDHPPLSAITSSAITTPSAIITSSAIITPSAIMTSSAIITQSAIIQ